MKSYIKQHPERLILLIILIIGSAMRFYNYSSFSLSNDELSALNRLRFDSFRELINGGIWVDGHPAGIQVFLFYWIKLFGNSEASIRLPFVIFGILAILFSYLTASKWFNKTTALFVAGSIAVLEFPILYSQIARPYEAGLLFSMLLSYFWTLILFDKKEREKWKQILIIIGFSLSISANFYNHYFNGLLTIIIGITGLFYLNKNNFKNYLIGGFLGILLFLPHVLITLNHLKLGGVGQWLGKPTKSWLFDHIEYIFNNSTELLIFVSVLFIVSIIIGWKKIKFSKFHLFSLLFFLIPFLVGYFYSVIVNPVLQNSTLIFSLPFFLFFVFSFLKANLSKFNITTLVLFIALGIFSTVYQNKFYKTYHFINFKGISEKLISWNNEYGKENISHSININHPYYIDYYLQRENESIKFKQYANYGQEDMLELVKIVNKSTTPYFTYSRCLGNITEITDVIKTQYPYLISYFDFGGRSETMLFSKEKPDTFIREHTVFKNFSYDYSKDSLTYLDINKLEFCSDFSEILYKDVNLIKKIKVSVKAYLQDNAKEIHLVMALSEKDGETYEWRGIKFSNYIENESWGTVFLNYKIPELKFPLNELKVYIWNPKTEKAKVKNLIINIYE